ncbi:MAG: XTP/dITP diphosphatase [Syntrophomonadaceae bacterium]|nr:XTP/dITP diphosphatase [Syntrophomonadaceae bacterium]
MHKRLLLATRNQHKKQELQAMLADLSIEILTLDDIAGLPKVDEDGATFAENASKKARQNAALSGMVCLADDSGLTVDVLDGRPGVYSARFAGPGANDDENNEKLLELMEAVPDDRRTASFVCAIAVANPQGKVSVVEGSCPGRIIRERAGTGGFGYDPLFVPDGYTATFAELEPEEKNRISHRGRALALARTLIEKYLCSE